MGCGSSTEGSDPNNNAGGKARSSPQKTTTVNSQSNSKPKSVQTQGKQEKSDREDPILQSEPEVHEVEVPRIEKRYPAARPAPNKKDDIFSPRKMKHVDQQARAITVEPTSTYETLIEKLTSGLTSDVERLRAIFVWLGNQDMDSGNFSGATDSGTPMGYMKLIQQKSGSYSAFFALLCRAAKIPCVIVNGIAKSVAYEPGDSDEKVKGCRNSWNAVYVAGGWRIVFPLWACTGIVGYSTGMYTKVESKGKAVREREEKQEGQNVRHLNETYFLTDPDKFIFMAFPDDARWQLIHRPWSVEKFADVPQIKWAYFNNGLEIKSKFTSRLRTIEGHTEVELKAENPNDLQLDYELFYNNKESGKDISSSLQLNNYVFLNRTDNSWKFNIRFPEMGIYKLEIDGGRNGYETLMCAFKVTCKEVLEDCQPLPVNPGKIGYGPNLDTRNAGIEAISHNNGLVKLSSGKMVQFKFNLIRSTNITSVLVHNTMSEDELRGCVQQTQNNRNVEVKVRVPQEGEYALQMYSQDKGETTQKNVLNYLLRTSDYNRRRRLRTWENPIEKNTRASVKTMSKTKGVRDVDDLEKAIERFEKLDMDDKGDLAAARDALELKKTKKELRDAVNRRHLQTLEKAIDHGKSSRFANELQPEITEAEDVRDHLKKLNRFAHDILEMKQPTISELKSYKKPPAVVHDVMYASFLMLGENPYFMEDWEDIQVLMGKTGKMGLIRRVRQFDTVHVKPETVTKVKWQLAKHDELTARNASAGCGTFYVWLQNVIGAIENNGNNNNNNTDNNNPGNTNKS